VIASWINHWDMKEENSLDMYVEENGRKFLRHYLIDFGSTLGGGKLPMEYFHGREYAVDFNNMVKEVFTLGIFKAPDEKEGVLISPQVGIFSANDFHPDHWKTSYPVMPFLNMTDEDAFWATRIILSFTEPELRSIVETAQYTDPRDTDYVLRILLERRRIVAEHWLRQINPIAYISVETRTEGVVINFHDLMVDWKFSDPANTTYAYEIRGPRYKSERKATRDTMILVDRRTLGEALEKDRSGEPVEITIWTKRTNSKPDPVKIYLYKKANGTFGLGRISRG